MRYRKSGIRRIQGMPETQRILDYLRANGPSTVAQMREDGLEVPRGLMTCLHNHMIVDIVGRERAAAVWRLV